MKKHKNIFLFLVIISVAIVLNLGYYCITKLQDYFAQRTVSPTANINTFSSPKLDLDLKYPASWIVDDQGDSVEIRPVSKGSIKYFTITQRADLQSLEDVKGKLAPTVITTPVHIDTASGFTYDDTDGHQSIWLLHTGKIYIIRVYQISEQAHQMLATIKFKN